MRIAMVVAGAGSMYCGACARDSDLARGLKELGHDVTIYPIYTPLRLEADLDVRQEPLQIGGISAFLREKSPRLARLLRPVRTLLDTPALITWASQFAVRTQASDLGQMTVSFLSGSDGPHSTEIQALANIVTGFRPDVVILANTLLAGLIAPLRVSTGAPVVCQVQGEDGFLDELPEPWRERAVSLLQKKARDAAVFMAPSQAHASDMSARLDQRLDRFAVVSPSVRSGSVPTKPEASSTRIGHLSSIRRAKGLDLLVTALGELGGESLELEVRGRVLEPDFYRSVCQQATASNLNFRFGGELPSSEKRAFLSRCDFIVLPSRLHESRGIVALEALSVGTPVIAPETGIFPELAYVTGGVSLYPPSGSLAETIRMCIGERIEWRERGRAAAILVAENYSPIHSARSAEECLRAIVGHS